MMRTTLRGGPSKGGNGNGNKATTFFSTGKSASKSPTRKKLSRAPGTLFSSRFDDSDDDDDDNGADDRVRNFHSRFADSSDEEEPGAKNNTASLRPVRGIPRRQGKADGESTDLEDSSDEEARRARSAALAAAAGTTGPTTRAKPSTSNRFKNHNAGTSGLAAVARSRGVSHEELEDFLHQKPSRKSGIFGRLNLRKSKNPEPKQLRKPTAETGTGATAAAKDPVLHHRGGSVTTTVTANNKANGRSHGWGSNTRHLGEEDAGEGGGWPLRSNRKADEEAVAAETKPSAVINEGDEAAERSTPGGTTRVERDDSAVAAAGVAGDGASAPTSAADRLAGEGSHFPRRDEDNNNNNNRDHGISARDVVIAGSGRKKRFPKLRRAFGLQ